MKKQNEVHAQFEREFTVFDNEEIKSIRTMQGKLVENYDSHQKYIYECTEDGEAYVFSLSTGQK